jgi:hypothetical protein
MNGSLSIVPRDAKIDYTIPVLQFALQFVGSLVAIVVTDILRRRSQS